MKWIRIIGLLGIVGSLYLMYNAVNGGDVDKTVTGFLLFLISVTLFFIKIR